MSIDGLRNSYSYFTLFVTLESLWLLLMQMQADVVLISATLVLRRGQGRVEGETHPVLWNRYQTTGEVKSSTKTALFILGM